MDYLVRSGADIRTLSEISVRVCDVVRKGGRILDKTAPRRGGDRKSNQADTTDRLIYDTTLSESGMKERTARRWRAAGKLSDEKYATWRDKILAKVERAHLTDLYRMGRPIQRRGEVGEAAELTGAYPVLYADPPWKYEHPPMGATGRSIENQYPTMTLEEIKAVKVPALDDSVLFLWATAPKLPECLEVMSAWGFLYRTNMVWVKDKIGTGYYVRNQHEHLLIGRRGELPVPTPGTQPSSVLGAPRAKHSEKPIEFYEVIEQLYPEFSGQWFEMFLRGEPRKGWAGGWGNEAITA